jgi:hypothetical protein
MFQFNVDTQIVFRFIHFVTIVTFVDHFKISPEFNWEVFEISTFMFRLTLRETNQDKMLSNILKYEHKTSNVSKYENKGLSQRV